MMRKTFAVLVMACILVTGCGSAKAEQTTPAQAEQAAVEATTEQAATTAAEASTDETATPATATTAATTAETATPATAAQAEMTPIHYIVVYDDGTEVSLYVEGDEVYFFEGGGRTKKDNIPGLSNLPKVSGRVKRSEIGDADLLDYIKENAY